MSLLTTHNVGVGKGGGGDNPSNEKVGGRVCFPLILKRYNVGKSQTWAFPTCFAVLLKPQQ